MLYGNRRGRKPRSGCWSPRLNVREFPDRGGEKTAFLYLSHWIEAGTSAAWRWSGQKTSICLLALGATAPRESVGGSVSRVNWCPSQWARQWVSESTRPSQWVGLLGIRSGDTCSWDLQLVLPPFCPQIPRIVRFHPLPTFPVQSLIRLLWNHAVAARRASARRSTLDPLLGIRINRC